MRGWLLIAVLPLGCATTATIVTRDGRRTEAWLAGGDHDQLLLRNEYGAESTVRREDVRDIDYPGNVHAVAGGVTAGLMGVELAVFGALCGNGSFSTASCPLQLTLFGTIGTAGLAMFAWGLWTWMNATSMVRETLDGPPLPVRAPVGEPAPPPPPPLVPVPSL